MYATGQIDDIGVAVLIQKPFDLHAACPVMTHADYHGILIQLVETGRNGMHGHVDASGNLAALHFSEFSHIQQ